MPAVELATGYVSLLPSAKGFASAIASEIGAPLERAGKEAGEKTGDGFASSFGSNAKKGIAAAGVAIGAVLGKGFMDSMGQEVGNDKLAAQLGLSDAESKRLGKVAGSLYGNAYGENLGQVNEAVRAVVQNIDGMGTASSPALKGITAGVLDVATAFDQDLGGTAAAVGQLMKTGMAKDATEALDIITVGFQTGADKRGDFLDTINEYGTQFRKLGIDGPTATGLISQGLQAGARDADIVADAIKEFSIRAVDGSKLSAEGFAMVGLDAGKMAEQIAKGGPAAEAGLGLVLERLRGIEDPAKRAQAATALFGTQAEDLGDALFALDPTKATADVDGFAGAAARVGETLAGNTATGLESWKRKFELATSGIASKLGPVLSVAPGFAGIAVAASSVGIPLDSVGKAMGGVAVSAAKATGAGIAQAASFVATKAASLAAAAASGIMTAAQWALNAAMAANPVLLVVVAIAALAAGVVLAYKHFEPFRDIVDALGRGLKDGLGAAAEWVVDMFKKWWPALLVIFTGGAALLPLIIFKNWDKITGFTGDMASAVVDFFSKLPGRVGGAFSSAWSTAWDAVTSKFTAVKTFIGDRIGDVVGFVTGLPGRIKDGLANTWSTFWGYYTGLGYEIRSFIGDRIGDVVGFVTGLPGRIRSAASGMFDGFRDAFRSALNWIIDKWNGLSFHIPGITVLGKQVWGGATVSTPNIPRLAFGGIATDPTLAVVGDGPGDEAIIPLPPGWKPGDPPMGAAAAMPAGDTHIYLDGREITKVVGPHLVDMIRARTGATAP